ncbi:HTH-type transcriptional regulator GltC [compost metagenome]
MKLETFATLAAVIEEGSFAAAAATMHLTPSAVSMQMKQLEQYVGQPLFDRSGLQVRPTAVAHEVAAAMEGGLRYLHALRRRVSVAVEGSVRLGVIESIQPVLLPGTLRHLRDHYPKLRVRPVRGRSAGLLVFTRWTVKVIGALVCTNLVPLSTSTARLWSPRSTFTNCRRGTLTAWP